MKNKMLLFYILSGAIYATQGFEALPSLGLFLYLKETLNFTPEKVMLIGSITGIAWIIKPLLGFAIDNYLTKKTWIILSLLGSIGIAVWMGLSPVLTIPVLIITGILANYNSASRDVAVDGMMCEIGKEANNCDRIQAIQWIAITVASIAVGLGGGYIAQNYSYKLAYLCLIPVYIVILGIVFNYKTKQPLKRKCCGCKFELECNDIQVVFSEGTNCYIPRLKKSFLQTLISYKQLFTNKSFLFACLFLFLYKFSPSFGTPLSYLERDVFGWSAQWMGTLGAICSIFEIGGAIIFYKYCKIINIKKWLTISVFLGACTSLSYLYFTPITAIVYGICYSIMGMFIHLIVMSFLAKSTLTGKEATSFALLCSVNNFAAGTASGLVGAWLLPIVGLQVLIILSAVTSFACLPLIRRLEIK